MKKLVSLITAIMLLSSGLIISLFGIHRIITNGYELIVVDIIITSILGILPCGIGILIITKIFRENIELSKKDTIDNTINTKTELHKERTKIVLLSEKAYSIIFGLLTITFSMRYRIRIIFLISTKSPACKR